MFFFETIVQEAHLDSFGHLNNARYLELFWVGAAYAFAVAIWCKNVKTGKCRKLVTHISVTAPDSHNHIKAYVVDRCNINKARSDAAKISCNRCEITVI